MGITHLKSKEIKCTMESTPFKRTLSFKGLFKELKSISQDESHMMQNPAQNILKEVDAKPELKVDQLSSEMLDKHKDFINLLMSFILNPVHNDIDIAGVYPPFEMNPFYTTQNYKDQFDGEYKKMEIASEPHESNKLIMMVYHAYFLILEKVYDIKLPIDLLFTIKLTDTRNHSIKYFTKTFDTRYLEVKTSDKFKKIPKEQIFTLFDKENDLDYWNELIPLSEFEFSGFLVFRLQNITREYIISELKSDLLNRDTIITPKGYERFLEKIRALMGNPLVKAGIVSTINSFKGLTSEFFWNCILPSNSIKSGNLNGTIYEDAYNTQQIQLIRDLKDEKPHTIYQEFLNQGISTIAVVPLVLDDKVVGLLEFGCTLPGSLTMVQIKVLFDLFPVFALAIKGTQEEWDDKIRAIIQEQFTAIHPSVEWRFRETAMQILRQNANNEARSIEPIIFSDVIPLYGASDIKGSSEERILAIQIDLKKQLEMAREILIHESTIREIPLLDDICFKINENISIVEGDLKAGDEVTIVEFLKKQIDPVLLLLKDRDPSIGKLVSDYFNALDPELGILYQRRKEFEDSLAAINDIINQIIETEQIKAQEVFPHYFEKYRTDGVEYNAYIGQSLVKSLNFNEVYLKNLRLWQLIVKVKIAREIKALQAKLKVKLSITQLVLVHSNPLSITFRQDEKKFDVAGAYNIRYEITKKRIDKALIKGTKERLNQVDKIAIIYSHADEIAEYKNYIDFMKSKEYIEDSIEKLDLEDLRGASGLKALRITVKYDA